MSIYTNLVRPLLFTLPPERIQKLADMALGIKPVWRAFRPFFNLEDERLHTNIGGSIAANPVGLAAGYDKDYRLLDSLSNLGFGYIVAGTVVSEPRYGNLKPRIIRNTSENSLVNSLGFPSRGLASAAARLKNSTSLKVPVIASISGLSVSEFLNCYRTLQPLASGVELNISSPNTDGIRIFQEPENLDELLWHLTNIKDGPLFLKLPPYFDEYHKDRTMAMISTCMKYGVEGVTAVNTRPIKEPRLAVGRGGLSGPPLYPHMLRIVREIRDHAGDKLIINACGGISSGEDALSALKAGANTVQLFTSFIYKGPRLMRDINRYILRFLEEQGITSLNTNLRDR